MFARPLTDSAGNSRGLIEAFLSTPSCVITFLRIPRGTPAASLKPYIVAGRLLDGGVDSAGNSRGLIEAWRSARPCAHRGGIPRGTPAASLKQLRLVECYSLDLRIPRGTPAASLKRFPRLSPSHVNDSDSAGNSRGLIEACRLPSAVLRTSRIPRGTPAASLKPAIRRTQPQDPLRIPRGTPAASLKPTRFGSHTTVSVWIPRGTPAASLKRRVQPPVAEGLDGFRGELPRPH